MGNAANQLLHQKRGRFDLNQHLISGDYSMVAAAQPEAE